MHIALQKMLGVQSHIDLHQQLRPHGLRRSSRILFFGIHCIRVFARVSTGIQGLDTQLAFGIGGACVGKENIAVILGDQEMLLLLHGFDQFGDLPHRRGTRLGPGEHQRNQGLIHHHGICLVDDGNVGFGTHLILAPGDQLIAQHVEAQLIDRAEDHVAGINIAALIAVQILGNGAVAQAEEVEHRAHPRIVTRGQVGVHGDHVHALALQRVAHGGHRTR